MKSTLRNQHDYMTVVVIDDAGSRINLTISRYGCKVTAKGDFNPSIFKAVSDGFMGLEKAFYAKKVTGTNGSFMEWVRSKGEAATSFSQFALLMLTKALEGGSF